jgi:S-DNA-T family DNA segregation ATPase FtsK/SpoIIIE
MAMVYKIIVFNSNYVNEFDTGESSGDVLIPLEVEEAGLNKGCSLRIVLKENKWIAENNKDLRLFLEEKELSSFILEPGSFLKAKITGISKSLFILFLKQDENYLRFNKYHIHPCSELKVGSAIENEICYKSIGISKLHAKISTNEAGEVYLYCIKAGWIFVNGIAVHDDSVKVKFADEINILGLKIIILDRILLLNNPENKVICSCKPADGFVLPEKDITLFVKNGFFTKTPRLIRPLEKDAVEIEAPPPSIQMKSQPLILTIGPSMTMSLAMLVSLGIGIYSLSSSSGGNPLTIATSGIMAVSMLIGAIMWPMLIDRYQKKTWKKEEQIRVSVYTKYLGDLNDEILKRVEWNRNILHEIYPDPYKIVERFENGSRKVWERTFQDEDFLDIRIGLGVFRNIFNINIPKNKLSLINDPLRDGPKKIFESYVRVKEMPITIPFMSDKVVGVIGKRNERHEIIKNMLIQLAGLHSYDELKQAFICNETQSKEFEWVKNLPHTWSSNKAVRFFASNKEEAHEILSVIDEAARDREEEIREGQQKKLNLPYFVIFILDIGIIEDEPAMRYLVDSKNVLGISAVFIGESMGILPSGCQTIVHYDDSFCGIYRKCLKEEGEVPFKADKVEEKMISTFSTSVVQYNLKNFGGEQIIPSSLDFLSLFRVGKAEQLDVGSRWQESLPHKSLAAPIGVKAGGQLFSLNLHEKYHGPHGLVAGMTGSGKSEFIQAYILSMAINYHPHDVSFILIDYKGGGMANCFKGLPHVSGMITNLGGNQIRRSLISIDAEIKRRQRIFDIAGVKHIDEYQVLHKDYLKSGNRNKSSANIPLPHLVIISDEFAELKNQQPEFMDKLVSTARIGRSLGVHLILATQKPSGVVNDQIWSNSRFKICLKVMDKQDSQEMLKRPEAAAITLPGRCYVQIGYNEIFECVQSGYSGAPYSPEEEYIDPDTQKVILIDSCAKPLKSFSSKKVVQETKQTQLEAVVSYINNYARNNGVQPLKLWVEPLKDIIYLENIPGFKDSGFDGEKWKASGEWMHPIIGLVDDPENQKQYPLKLDIGNKGHVVLYGMPGTGKTTFLQTLIYSIACTYSRGSSFLYPRFWRENIRHLF